MLFRLLVGVMVIGGVLFFVGFQDWRLATKAHGTPQAISAAQLEGNGPGPNAHIRMSDFLMCEWSYVYETSSRSANSPWKTVWVPVVPLDSPYAHSLSQLPPGAEPPTPPNIRIIVKSKKCKTENEVHQIASLDSLDGMVINEIESLGGEEKKILSDSYPGIDFSRCYIVEADRKPAGADRVIGMMGGGGTLLLLGAAFLVSQMKNA